MEAELAGTLPFAGQHDDAEALLNLTPARVLNNARLRDQLQQQGAQVDSLSGAINLTEVENLQFDAGPLVELFEMIVRGLYFHHWQLRLAPEFEVRARAFPSAAASPVLNLFRVPTETRVEENIGNGAFLYQGFRTTDNPNASLWRFRLLGGLTLLSADGARVFDEFLVMTLRREFLENLAAE